MHKQAAWLQVPALNHQPPCFTTRLPPRALGAAQPPWLHCGSTQPSSPRQPSPSHPHPPPPPPSEWHLLLPECHYGPGTLPGTRDTEVNKTDRTSCAV